MEFGTLSEKGQITVPSKLRKQFGMKPKDRLSFEPGEHGIIISKAVDFRSLKGAFAVKSGLSYRQMRKKMELEVAEEIGREIKNARKP